MNPSEFSTRLGSGYFMDDLQAAVHEVAEAVVRTGQKGTVTVTLEIEAVTKGDIQVTIREKFAKKPPVEPSRGAVLFVGDEEFFRIDPRQDTLAGFREITSDGEVVRDGPADVTRVRTVGEE